MLRPKSAPNRARTPRGATLSRNTKKDGPGVSHTASGLGATRDRSAGVLQGLGLIGLDAIEPIIVAALTTAEPMILIGPHGTGKSYLLNRVAEALQLEWRHYNASLLNFDDLVGFPIPNGNGGLDYAKTPAAIWGAGAVIFDEISRCRPDIQNKLFPIIHERRVQGILVEELVYRWAAMNPPQPLDEDDWDGNPYRGSEPLDAALADRFAFVLEMPAWSQLNERQQIEIIRASETPVCPTVCGRLGAAIGATRTAIPSLAESFSEPLAVYVRTMIALLTQAGIELSPRRGGMILRNILAVHAAYLTVTPTAKPADAAYLAVRHSLPQRALGQKIDEVKLLAAHREAWRITGIKPNDPLRAILSEADPLRRAALAIRAPKIPNGEFSSIIADSLAALPMGSREALAAELFETGAAGRMVAAIAEQTAELYGHVALNPSFSEVVAGHGERFKTWKHIEVLLSRLDPENAETHLVANLLANHFVQGNLSQPTDIDPVLARWRDARQLLGGHTS